MKFLLVFVVIFTLQGSACGKDPPPSPLVTALIQVESSGGKNLVGDKRLKNKAYGCLQIRKLCLVDVNKKFGTNHTLKDCLDSQKLSIWVFERYMEIYATKEKIGRDPTDEDRARIWNGGPDGWQESKTVGYWEKVKKELDKLELKKKTAKGKELVSK